MLDRVARRLPHSASISTAAESPSRSYYLGTDRLLGAGGCHAPHVAEHATKQPRRGLRQSKGGIQVNAGRGLQEVAVEAPGQPPGVLTIGSLAGSQGGADPLQARDCGEPGMAIGVYQNEAPPAYLPAG